MFSGSRPAEPQAPARSPASRAARASRTRRRDRADVLGRRAAAAADDVEEAALRRTPRAGRRSAPASRRSRSPTAGSAARRSDSSRRRCRRPSRAPRCTAASASRRARSSSPTASGRAWRTEFQNASGVWPESVRPDWSVIVPEIITGSRCPLASNTLSIAKSAALAFSVSKIVSTRRRSTPPSTRPAERFGVGCDQLVERDVAEARVVDVGRDRRGLARRPEHAGDEARPVRRLRGELVGRLAREPRRREVQLVGEAPPCRSRRATARSS